MNTIEIPIALIDDNPYQARTTYTPEGIERLAASIKESGLLQPPMGRLVDAVKGRSVTAEEFALFMADIDKQRCSAEELLEMHGCRVQIAFGHRRLRAYRSAGGCACRVDGLERRLPRRRGASSDGQQPSR